MQKSLKTSILNIPPPIFARYDFHGQGSKTYQNLHVRL